MNNDGSDGDTQLSKNEKTPKLNELLLVEVLLEVLGLVHARDEQEADLTDKVLKITKSHVSHKNEKPGDKP